MSHARMPDLIERLAGFVDRLGVPAAGLALIEGNGSCLAEVTGVAHRGHTVPVAIDQQWHIGSCAKSITAALYARLVEQGRAGWGVRVTELVPDLADVIHPGWAGPTVDDVLQCRAGIRPNLTGRAFRAARRDTRTPVDQRTATVRETLVHAPTRHGRFRYSNLGYILVGAAIDRIAGSYETALDELVLEPLGITGVGYGAPPDICGHRARVLVGPIGIGRGRPISPDRPGSDNPEVYTPAGRLHLPLLDWTTIVRRLFLDGPDRLLADESVDRLLEVPPGGTMAMGWAGAPRQLPSAEVAMQGSNTRWAATALIDTARRRAVLLVANDGRTRVLAASARIAHDVLTDPTAKAA